MTEQAVALERAGYWSAAKAATINKSTVYTIYRWIKAKQIEGVQVSGHWYVEKKSLQKKMLEKVKDPAVRKRIETELLREAG